MGFRKKSVKEQFLADAEKYRKDHSITLGEFEVSLIYPDLVMERKKEWLSRKTKKENGKNNYE